jgi:hypothetical protein
MTGDNPVTLTAEPRRREVVIARVFDAPRELMFKTCTDPNLIKQWWGPNESSTAVDEMDVRFGGVWRYVQRGPDGNEFAFNVLRNYNAVLVARKRERSVRIPDVDINCYLITCQSFRYREN